MPYWLKLLRRSGCTSCRVRGQSKKQPLLIRAIRTLATVNHTPNPSITCPDRKFQLFVAKFVQLVLQSLSSLWRGWTGAGWAKHFSSPTCAPQPDFHFLGVTRPKFSKHKHIRRGWGWGVRLHHHYAQSVQPYDHLFLRYLRTKDIIND